MSCHEPIKARGQLVACAYCPGCRSRRSATWAVRLEDELRVWDRSCFLTLTVSPDPREYARELFRRYGFDEKARSVIRDEDFPQDLLVRRRDLQLFFKRMRRLGMAFKYYAVGEYGERSARAHYHVLLFGLDVRDRAVIEKSWPFGMVDIGRVEPASIRYVTGYVMKAPLGRLRLHAERSGANPPFSVMSQGLGSLQGRKRAHTLTTIGAIRIGAKVVSSPRYYVSLLSEDDRRKYLSARRERLMADAVRRVGDGGEYVKNDVQVRAYVSRVDHKARARSRGSL